MRAVRLRHGRPSVAELAEPRRPPGEALIRVTLAGICGTDLELAKGYMGFAGTPGHEFVGRVEQADDPGWIGRRVVGEINAACGTCGTCRAGLRRHCPQRTVLGILDRDGAFAERVLLPADNLHRIPDALADEIAVFTEPLAAAFEILEQVQPRRGTRCLVLGDGRLGQLCAAVLASADCAPVVLGRHRAKLARLERMGFKTADISTDFGREFELVVEATGSPDGLAAALATVRPRGTIVLKSTCHEGIRADLVRLVIDEIRLVGSRCGPFPPAIDHLLHHPSTVDGMVTARYPLARVDDAFEHAARRDALKILLEI